MKRITLLLGIAFVGALLFACVRESVPVEKSKTQEVTVEQLQIIEKEPWELEWERTLTEAKKEGNLVVYTDQSPSVRNTIAEAIKKKYGINLDIVGGAGSQLAAKTLMERRAGLYLVDMSISGTGTATSKLEPAGILAPIGPELILPEVLDPEAWFEKRVPFFNKDGTIFTFSAYVRNTILRNKDLVSREEIKSYKDLLNPRWKGKILWLDPFDSTGAGAQFARVGVHIMGYDFMRELAKQRPVLTKDKRLVIEWVARGKYPLSLGSSAAGVFEFVQVGAPIDEFSPEEGGYLTSGGSAGNFYIYKNPPHPSARKLFINWLLSREGQTLWSKVGAVQSARIDVPTDHFDPNLLRKPGIKYVNASTEEWELGREKEMDIVLEILKSLIE